MLCRIDLSDDEDRPRPQQNADFIDLINLMLFCESEFSLFVGERPDSALACSSGALDSVMEDYICVTVHYIQLKPEIYKLNDDTDLTKQIV